MTYCVGISVREGLVMIADTRTNAGIDNIATFRKLHVFEQPGERIMCICTSGNLSVSQAVLNYVQEGLEHPETGAVDTIMNMPSMFKAAQLIGRAIRTVYALDGRSLEEHHAKFDVAMLFGGQIRGGKMRLFMIYSAGNFIEVTVDTPYLQIGEHKYGKPILDRAVNYSTDMQDALKLGLLSMDSTMRSNLGVGMPIDVLVARRDAHGCEVNHRIEPGDPYFHDLRERWSAALRAAHTAIPRPPYRRSDRPDQGQGIDI
jgi:putative proteasome-type protease